MKNTELKSILIARDGPFCYECNFHAGYPSAKTLDLHHGLIHTSKRFHDALTNEINCVLICRDCHPYCNSFEWRVKFLRKQVEKYGFTDVSNWYLGMPEKLQKTNSWIWNALMNINLDSLGEELK